MLNTIRLKDSGDLVKIAQYMLGYAERKQANGIYDDRFAAEVGDWQAQHKLTVDYIIGKDTWTEMAKAMPTCSTSKNKTSAYTCAIQLLVGGLTVDGIYVTNTKKAVTAYQTAANLTADGICGPKTWNMLIVGKTTSTSTSTPTTSAGQTVTGSKVLNNCVKYL